MTYFATKQKIDEIRFSEPDERFYCKGPEYFVCFLFPSEPYFIEIHELFRVREDLRKEAGEGFEVHIYETSIPRDKFDSSRAWDYVIDYRAKLLIY